MAASPSIRLPDGRRLAYDDIGDRSGRPVVYLHGTPDSRLARHPEDALADAAGVRLLAVDRPGAGDSDVDPGRDLAPLGDDLACLLDELGIERAAILGWSAGGLAALAVASHRPDRVARLVLVGTVPPVEAYRDERVLGALGARRRAFVELALEVPAAELAAELAPHLVPQPLTPELARAHVLEGAGEHGRAELAAVPGAVDQLVRALGAAVRQGCDGLEADLARQLQRGLDLAQVAAPVRLVHGTLDDVSPPAVGEWLAAYLPDARLDVVEGGSHHLLFPGWSGLLAATRG